MSHGFRPEDLMPFFVGTDSTVTSCEQLCIHRALSKWAVQIQGYGFGHITSDMHLGLAMVHVTLIVLSPFLSTVAGSRS